MRADLFGASGAIRGEDEDEFAGEEAELEEGAGDGGRPVEMNEEEAVRRRNGRDGIDQQHLLPIYFPLFDKYGQQHVLYVEKKSPFIIKHSPKISEMPRPF